MSHLNSYWQIYLTALICLLLNGYAFSSLDRHLMIRDKVRFTETTTAVSVALREIERHCINANQRALSNLTRSVTAQQSTLEFYSSASSTKLSRMGLNDDGLLWPSHDIDPALLSSLHSSIPPSTESFPVLKNMMVIERIETEKESILVDWPQDEINALFTHLPKSTGVISATELISRPESSRYLAGHYIYLIKRVPRDVFSDEASQERESLTAYLISRFRWEDLLEEALIQSDLINKKNILISLENPSEILKPSPLFPIPSHKERLSKRLEQSVEFKIANKVFSVKLRPRTQFFNTLPHRLLIWSLSLGALITILMTWMVRTVVVSRNCNISLVNQLSDTQVQLEDALTREQNYSAMKSRFVSVLTHEIRNPLGVILWGAQSLQRYRGSLSQKQQDTQFHNIRSAIHRIKGLMEETLLIGRIEQEQFVPTISSLNLEEFCREIFEEIRISSIYRSRLELHSSLTTSIHSDKSVLRHIVTNLIDNALKYSPGGEQVTVRLSDTSSHFVITIQDQGIGIPVDEQDQIFVNFCRGSNVAKIHGTGLGLPLVKQCINALEGELRLKSSSSAGTLITVKLPIHPTNIPTDRSS